MVSVRDFESICCTAGGLVSSVGIACKKWLMTLWYLAAVGVCLNLIIPGLGHAEECRDVKLSDEEVRVVKRLANTDKMVKGMAEQQDAATGLNAVLSAAARGPGIITFIWNQGVISAWRNLNPGMEKIAKGATCMDIFLMQETKGNARCFWENMYVARGCDAFFEGK
jgi:hypothetical protein